MLPVSFATDIVAIRPSLGCNSVWGLEAELQLVFKKSGVQGDHGWHVRLLGI